MLSTHTSKSSSMLVLSVICVPNKKFTSPKTSVDQVGYCLMSSSWFEQPMSPTLTHFKEPKFFLNYTNGLAYVMSSLWFKPPISVNIRPLSKGS